MAAWYDTYMQHRSDPFVVTQVPAEEEQNFKVWLTALPWYKEIQTRVPADVNLYKEMTGPNADYDLYLAHVKGVEPLLYEYDGLYHWPSVAPDGTMLKAPTHDTAWMEYFMREMNIDPNAVGLHNAEQANTWTNQLYSVMNNYPIIWK